MRIRVFLYRRRGLLGLVVILALVVVVGLLAAPALRATQLGHLVRLGTGSAVEDGVATGVPGQAAARPPAVDLSTTTTATDVVSTISSLAVLPVRAADLDHATVPTSAVATAFNCARQRTGLAPYVVDAQLTAEANTVATRIQTGGRGPQPGEQGWTLTGTLVLDTSHATQDCMVGGVDLSDVPDLERAGSMGIAVVPLPEPNLVLAVVVGR